MEMVATFTTRNYDDVEDMILHLNFDKYGIFEFSYGGFRIKNFLKVFFTSENNPSKIYKCIFSKKYMREKKYISTSAGSILLGLIFMNMVSEYKLNHQIFKIIKWFQDKIQNKTPTIHYYSLGIVQKEFMTCIANEIPSEYLQMSVGTIATTLHMGYLPEFIYYTFPNTITPCDANTTIMDAIKKSSDVFGINDGGISQIVPGYIPLYKYPKALVFAITDEYKPLCQSADILYFK